MLLPARAPRTLGLLALLGLVPALSAEGLFGQGRVEAGASAAAVPAPLARGVELALDAAARIQEQLEELPMTHLPIEPRAGRRYLGSAFGPRRAPRRGASTNHQGIDIPYPSGTPVLAAAAGRVHEVGRDAGRGRYVILEHDSGHQTEYLHLSRVRCSRGQRVTPGQPLGAVGRTGRVTGAHLHFELRDPSGRHLDPEPFLLELGAPPRGRPRA